jgi:hypothetical protein
MLSIGYRRDAGPNLTPSPCSKFFCRVADDYELSLATRRTVLQKYSPFIHADHQADIGVEIRRHERSVKTVNFRLTIITTDNVFINYGPDMNLTLAQFPTSRQLPSQPALSLSVSRELTGTITSRGAEPFANGLGTIPVTGVGVGGTRLRRYKKNNKPKRANPPTTPPAIPPI